MQRRNFIKNAGAAASLPLFLNGMQLAAMPRSSMFDFLNPDSDRVLVLVQMNGGNDGLNMIVPRDQYSGLAAVRSNVMIPEAKVLKLTDKTGIHPAMTGLKALYDDAKLGVVQAAGYPNQNRSHFRSTDIWTSASPANQFWNTGWMGRYFQEDHENYPNGYPNAEEPHPFAITMGSVVSQTCQGTASNFSLTLENPFNLFPLAQGAGSTPPNTPYGRELTFLRTSIVQTNAYATTITAAAKAVTNKATYPDNNRLAAQLKNVALLIAGGLQTKVYVVSIGGFDTHANQVIGTDTTTGEHAELLKALSDAISAFQNDLKLLNIEQRVVGMTFSEFGRRIRSNESMGTDHGTAAPLMLFGSCVNPRIHGQNPTITADVTRDEGVAMQHDFRDIYGSILMDWFGATELDAKVLLHQNFRYVPVLRNCNATTSIDEPNLLENLELQSFPNPFRDLTTIRFQLPQDAWVRLSVFDSLGSELQVLFNKRLNSGAHQIPFNGANLASGVYFYRLQVENQVKTERMVKIE
jgi:uncharacterized protein (DUF1501 family)